MGPEGHRQMPRAAPHHSGRTETWFKAKCKHRGAIMPPSMSAGGLKATRAVAARCPLERQRTREGAVSLGTILLIILILILIGAVPTWPYSRGWGYGPSGIVGVLLIVLLILVLMGRI